MFYIKMSFFVYFFYKSINIILVLLCCNDTVYFQYRISEIYSVPNLVVVCPDLFVLDISWRCSLSTDPDCLVLRVRVSQLCSILSEFHYNTLIWSYKHETKICRYIRCCQYVLSIYVCWMTIHINCLNNLSTQWSYHMTSACAL